MGARGGSGSTGSCTHRGSHTRLNARRDLTVKSGSPKRSNTQTKKNQTRLLTAFLQRCFEKERSVPAESEETEQRRTPRVALRARIAGAARGRRVCAHAQRVRQLLRLQGDRRVACWTHCNTNAWVTSACCKRVVFKRNGSTLANFLS